MSSQPNSGDSNSLVKLSFKLTVDQIGPFPVTVESLWCVVEGDYFRIKNIPFFVDELSFDDLISVSKVSAGIYQIAAIISPSGNSTIWLLVRDVLHGKQCLESLSALGCGVEGGVLSDYYAVNVPESVAIDMVLPIIDNATKSNWISVDYPSIRHSTSFFD
jgi:Domain of unknown function (DUF4265)